MIEFKERITAIGSYVPERRLTNYVLEKMVEMNEERMVRRAGYISRINETSV